MDTSNHTRLSWQLSMKKRLTSMIPSGWWTRYAYASRVRLRLLFHKAIESTRSQSWSTDVIRIYGNHMCITGQNDPITLSRKTGIFHENTKPLPALTVSDRILLLSKKNRAGNSNTILWNLKDERIVSGNADAQEKQRTARTDRIWKHVHARYRRKEAGESGQKGEGSTGKTPTQASFVEVDGSNKWKTIIQNAALREENSI